MPTEFVNSAGICGALGCIAAALLRAATFTNSEGKNINLNRPDKDPENCADICELPKKAVFSNRTLIS
jgi:hypothetical protein